MPIVYKESRFEFTPAEPQEPLALLQSFGYTAADITAWRPEECKSAPKLSIRILRHLEVQGHKWYVLSCSLSPRVEQPPSDQPDAGQDASGDAHSSGCRRVEWRVKRRMRHLRQGLHDPVKAICGKAYAKVFQGAHFAFHTSMPGTTDRLNHWLEVLATSIDVGDVAPSIAALVLHFLEPPGPGDEAQDPNDTDYSDLARLSAAARPDNGTPDPEAPPSLSRESTVSSLYSEMKSKTYSRWYWWLMPVPP
mmetsp:Transcript_11400/g.23131  ORF Transcript_11400/g.23131 Transcript_11400/m.23131 type:complete len:250 (+) Transcript_11400:65-814(+)